ncbi:MAG: hypothetical protein GC159_20450 [Phycisphaera sp.]|nr:hypothetical protein [Phycisphaera sp.]
MGTPHEELDQLLDALVEGDITDAQHDRLTKMLAEDDTALQRYLDFTAINAGLSWKNRWIYTQAFEEMPALDERGAKGTTRRFGWRFATAAALLIAATVTVAFIGGGNTHRHGSSGPTVAMIVDASSDAVWADRTTDMGVGNGLSAGTLQLTKGSAQLMFNSGAVVSVTGPARFELNGDTGGRLYEGSVTAHVPPKAHGFTIEGPDGISVVDLGTEFTMYVDDIGKTRVYVLDGQVNVVIKGETYNVEARQGMVVDFRGTVTRTNADNPLWLGDALTHTHQTHIETFDSGKLPSGWEAVAPGLIDYPDGRVRITSPDDATRCYLRTTRTDWSNRSFVAEVTITVGDSGGIGGAFFGLGEGLPGDGPREPSHGPSAFVVAWPNDFVPDQSLRWGDFNVESVSGTGRFVEGSEGMAGSGTHRLRMVYDAETKRAAFSIDRNYTGGPFHADFSSQAMDLSDNGFDATNSRIFIGGGKNARFDDLVVREYDLKSAKHPLKTQQ